MSDHSLLDAAEKITQLFMDKFTELYNAVPGDVDPFYLAAMRCFHDAMLPMLSRSDRWLYDALTEKSETTVLPLEAAPGRQDDGD